MKNKKGFTIIELGITIVIIAVLATLAITAFNSSRGRARDTQRVHDVNQIKSALELYYNRYKTYPTAITAGQAFAINGFTYLDPVPSNPTPRTDGSCPDNQYAYASPGNNATYYLTFCIGSAASELAPGTHTCQNGSCN